jgi:hypothetical protein
MWFVCLSACRHLVHRLACAHARLHLRSVATLVDMCVGIMIAEENIALRFGAIGSALQWSRIGLSLDELNINSFRESALARPLSTRKVMATFYQTLLRKTLRPGEEIVSSAATPATGRVRTTGSNTFVQHRPSHPFAAATPPSVSGAYPRQYPTPSSIAPIAASSGNIGVNGSGPHFTPQPTAAGGFGPGGVGVNATPFIQQQSTASHITAIHTPQYAGLQTPAIQPFGTAFNVTPQWNQPVSNVHHSFGQSPAPAPHHHRG